MPPGPINGSGGNIMRGGNPMNKILTLLCGLAIAAIGFTIVNANTGWEGATRIERGRYVESRSVAIDTFTATGVIFPSNKRPASLCKNFSSYTIYIGSGVAGISSYLTTIGLPIGASEYFKVDGSYTGTINTTAEAGATNVKIKSLDGLVP